MRCPSLLRFFLKKKHSDEKEVIAVYNMLLMLCVFKATDREGDPITYNIQNGDPQHVFNLSRT